MEKPFSPACERNQDAIRRAILPKLKATRKLLEIGSGTGQHAVYVTKHMPWLDWQCSDIQENLSGITAWIHEARLNNLPDPIPLDVSVTHVTQKYDTIYSCNTLHIMSTSEVEALFNLAGTIATDDAGLLIYGPFKYGGKYTADSNVNFDQWLKERDPKSGVRDFEWVNTLANKAGFKFITDQAMPANNNLLYWRRRSSSSLI